MYFSHIFPSFSSSKAPFLSFPSSTWEREEARGTKQKWQYRKSRLNNCHFERSEKSCDLNLPQKISPFGRDDTM
jgi:hypothetical protein